MTPATGIGSHLLLPLTRLDAPAPAPAPAPPVTRTLDLDAQASDWAAAVRASAECCLLLDADGRVCAASASAATVLGHGRPALGVRFRDLVISVDFTSGAAPELEPERSMPPLRALATGGLARGLMRLRTAEDDLVTYDVVAVPLRGSVGALAFFHPV